MLELKISAAKLKISMVFQQQTSRTSGLKGRTFEIMQLEGKKEKKRRKRNKESLHHQVNTEGAEKEKGRESLFDEITTENSLKLEKKITIGSLWPKEP